MFKYNEMDIAKDRNESIRKLISLVGSFLHFPLRMHKINANPFES